jgi:hypothetical protein
MNSQLSTRLVPIPQPERVLDESELRGAFAACSRDNELWLAINQVLRAFVIEAGYETADPENAKVHGSLAHSAGGFEWLGRFQAELEKRFAESHTTWNKA